MSVCSRPRGGVFASPGLIASTLLTLLIIPSLYSVVDALRQRVFDRTRAGSISEGAA